VSMCSIPMAESRLGGAEKTMLRSGCKDARLREWRWNTNSNLEVERLESMNGTSMYEGVLCTHSKVKDGQRRKNKSAMCMQKDSPRANIVIAFLLQNAVARMSGTKQREARICNVLATKGPG
jgi:hypothetical protein